MDYSVLMSVYKNEKPEFMEIAIESILDQTLSPEEVIVVCDGKLTSQLNAILVNFKKKYPELFTIVNLKTNVGLGLALNEGIKVSRNNLIARMDTDDIALFNRCEKQVKEFELNPDLAIVGSNVDEFTSNSYEILRTRKVPAEHEDIIKFANKRNPFNHPSVMYKKDVIEELGGYKDYRRNQDYDLFMRLLKNGYYSKNINESLLLFRANTDNLKRRKSLTRISIELRMRWRFYKKGYIGLIDFLFSVLFFSIVFLVPNFLFEKISNKYLRNGIN